MTRKSNFEKLYQLGLDTHEEMMEMFTAHQIERINKGDAFVAYATDKFMSGWGMSKNMPNKVYVICWSEAQAQAVYKSLCESEEMHRPNYCTLNGFIALYKRNSTWSIKEANDCTAWNKGITVDGGPI